MDQDHSPSNREILDRIRTVKDRINDFNKILKSIDATDKKNEYHQNHNRKQKSRKHSFYPLSYNSRSKSVSNHSGRRKSQQHQKVSLYPKSKKDKYDSDASYSFSYSDDENYDNSLDFSSPCFSKLSEFKPSIKHSKYRSKSHSKNEEHNTFRESFCSINKSTSSSSSDEFNLSSINRNSKSTIRHDGLYHRKAYDSSSSSDIDEFFCKLTGKSIKDATNSPNTHYGDQSTICISSKNDALQPKISNITKYNFDSDTISSDSDIEIVKKAEFNEKETIPKDIKNEIKQDVEKQIPKTARKVPRALKPKFTPIINDDDDDEPRPKMLSKSFENSESDENDFERYQKVVKKIGEGSTSITYKVIDTKTKTYLCKKVLKYFREHKIAYKNVRNMMKEFEVLQKLDHPCICKAFKINYLEKVNDKNIEKTESDSEITTVALFLEYLDHKLKDVLKSEINNTLKVRIIVEIAHAMNFLHKKGLIHRDLKIDNIMLDSSYKAKVVDFGLVQIRELFDSEYSFLNESMSRGVGTLAFMSPEMLNEADYDYKTDVYSFGIVLYFIFFRNLPKQNFVGKSIGESIDIPSSSILITNFGIDLIKRCLEFEPSKRPSFEEILNDIRKNNFLLAPDVDQSSICKRDKELKQFHECNNKGLRRIKKKNATIQQSSIGIQTNCHFLKK